MNAADKINNLVTNTKYEIGLFIKDKNTNKEIKHKDNSKELYNKKVESWSKRFDNLNIIEW